MDDAATNHLPALQQSEPKMQLQQTPLVQNIIFVCVWDFGSAHSYMHTLTLLCLLYVINVSTV